jgi:hypothetical protein
MRLGALAALLLARLISNRPIVNWRRCVSYGKSDAHQIVREFVRRFVQELVRVHGPLSRCFDTCVNFEVYDSSLMPGFAVAHGRKISMDW